MRARGARCTIWASRVAFAVLVAMRRELRTHRASIASRLAWTTPNAPSPRPSGSSAATGAKARPPASATPTPNRAPAAIPGSGTGTPASPRSSTGTSSRAARGPSWRACSPPSAPTASSATRSSGAGRSPACGAPSTTSRAAPRGRPRRSSRRCWHGPGGSRSATRPRSRGSAPRPTGCSRNRDLEGDGLLWIVQPDESGLDASPKFGPVWGRRADGRAGFPFLVERNRRLGWDARQIRDRGGPVLCETLVNTLWSLSLRSLGRPSATPALVERLWDERRGLFVDEAQPGGLRPTAGHLGEPGSAGATRPTRDDRPAAGRGAPPQRARVPHPGGAAFGLGFRAHLPAGRQPRPDPPLLARPDLDQRELAGLAGDAPARLPRGGRAPRRGRDRRRRPLRPARVLRPTRRHRPRGEGVRLERAGRRAGRSTRAEPPQAAKISLGRTQGGRQGERTPVRDPKPTTEDAPGADLQPPGAICTGR